MFPLASVRGGLVALATHLLVNLNRFTFTSDRGALALAFQLYVQFFFLL
jgi:hypothetical protein